MNKLILLTTLFFLQLAALAQPCEMLTVQEVQTILSIPDTAKAKVESPDHTYPTCHYTWESVQYSKTKTIAGREMNIDYPAEVYIIMVKEATEAQYKRSIQVYKDGVTIDGIGSMATWSDERSQLTFLAAGTLVHVNVKVTADTKANKAKAQKLALQIIEKM